MGFHDALKEEIREAQLSIARYESSVFSESFVKVFSALIEGSEINSSAEELLSEISELTKISTSNKLGELEESSKAYRELQALVSKSISSKEFASSAVGALAVYRDALKDRSKFQKETFEQIDSYFQVVNTFLRKKELNYELASRRVPKVGLKFPDGSWSSIRVMSSGERQLLTMLYAVNQMSGNTTVLIDEPEISLHVDWQEELLGKMMEQLGDRQIIVCTHAPSIAADFDEYMKEVTPVFNDLDSSLAAEEIDDEDML